MLRRTACSGISEWFSCPLLAESTGDIFLIFSVRTCSSSRRKISQNCGSTFYDSVLLEFLTLRIFHAEPLAIHQLQCRLFCPSTESAPVSHDSLYSAVSPVLEAVVCPVSSPISWMPKGLLIFQFAQISICQIRVVTSKLFTCRTGNHLDPNQDTYCSQK